MLSESISILFRALALTDGRVGEATFAGATVDGVVGNVESECWVGVGVFGLFGVVLLCSLPDGMLKWFVVVGFVMGDLTGELPGVCASADNAVLSDGRRM